MRTALAQALAPLLGLRPTATAPAPAVRHVGVSVWPPGEVRSTRSYWFGPDDFRRADLFAMSMYSRGFDVALWRVYNSGAEQLVRESLHPQPDDADQCAAIIGPPAVLAPWAITDQDLRGRA